MSYCHIADITYGADSTLQRSLRITGKPYVHCYIIATIVPSVVRDKLQRCIHCIRLLCTIVSKNVSLQSDVVDAIHNTLRECCNLTLLVDICQDIVRCYILIVWLLGTIYQWATSYAYTINISLHTLISYRVADWHRKLNLNLVTRLPGTLHRHIAINYLGTNTLAINLHNSLISGSIGVRVELTWYKLLTTPGWDTHPHSELLTSLGRANLDSDIAIEWVVCLLLQSHFATLQWNRCRVTRIEYGINIVVGVRVCHTRNLWNQTSHI